MTEKNCEGKDVTSTDQQTLEVSAVPMANAGGEATGNGSAGENKNVSAGNGGGKNGHGRKRHSPASVVFAVVEPWPEPVNGAELLDAIRKELQRFVVFPKWAVEVFALWILHTFAFRLRDVTTYVGIESPEKECGKSTLVTVLSRFVSRPAVSSNISSSAFYRVIEEEDGGRGMRAVETAGRDGAATEVRAVCGRPRRGNCEGGAADSGGADEPGGGDLGAVAGAGGPGGRSVAGSGVGSCVGIDGAGAGAQSHRVIAAGYIHGVHSGEPRSGIQPGVGGGVTAEGGPAMAGAKARQTDNGDVAGAAVGCVWN